MRKQEKSQGTVKRLIKTMFGFYPRMLPVTLVCIVFSALISSIPAIFMQNVIALIETSWQSGDWGAAAGRILPLVGILCVFCAVACRSHDVYTAYGCYHAGLSAQAARKPCSAGCRIFPSAILTRTTTAM